MRSTRNSPEDDLDQWIHQELRRLPDCPAPEHLAQRVLDRLQRRRELAWWRQSLWIWPVPCRWLALAWLVLLSLAVVGISTGLWRPFEIPTLSLGDWAGSLLPSWGGPSFWPKGLSGWWSVPQASTWLLGIGLFCALVYLLVVGIGTILVQLTGPAQSSHTTRNA